MDKSLLLMNTGNSFLVTLDRWFHAPDGRMYNAVWGKVAAYNDTDLLGIKTNAKSTNWYLLIGDDEKQVVVAGCQVHFAVVCDKKPNTGPVTEQKYHEATGTMVTVTRDNFIYLAQ